MPTETPSETPSAPRRPSYDSTSDLVALVHAHSRAVVDAELHRLARRAPSLRPSDLEVIDAALDELVELLLLARLRNAREHAGELGRLFACPSPAPGSLPSFGHEPGPSDQQSRALQGRLRE